MSKSLITVVVVAVTVLGLFMLRTLDIKPTHVMEPKRQQKAEKFSSASMIHAFNFWDKQPESDIKHFDETSTLTMIPSFYQCDQTKYSR